MRFAPVDSQCHASPVWYEPVEALLEQMTRHGVAQAVLIQMLGQFDNGYQQECLKRFPGRFASVVMVDPNVPQALTLLKRLSEEGASGVRLRPTARSPGPDPLAIWRCAQECHLAVSCVGGFFESRVLAAHRRVARFTDRVGTPRRNQPTGSG